MNFNNTNNKRIKLQAGLLNLLKNKRFIRLIAVLILVFSVTAAYNDFIGAQNQPDETEGVIEETEQVTVSEFLPPHTAQDRGEVIYERPKFVQDPNGVIDGHKIIAENEVWEMYLKENSLSIILRNRETSAVIYSTVEMPDPEDNILWQTFMSSGIAIEYLVGTNQIPSRANMFTKNTEVRVSTNESGFGAFIDFVDIGISFELNVTLTDEGFIAHIPEESIVEAQDRYKLGSVYVFPFLGYSRLGMREGYMFVPDGSGMLIYLEDNRGAFTVPFSKMVYGNDFGIAQPYILSLFNGIQFAQEPEKILAPVFGMVHSDSQIGFLGIIEEGEYHASIEAYPSGVVTSFNWISAKFTYRQVYVMQTSRISRGGGALTVRQRDRNDFDIKIRYEFVTGDSANYAGLAARYRNFLLNQGMIQKKDIDFNVRIDFLGAEKEDGLFHRRPVRMTTTDQAGRILKSLRNLGVTNILTVYHGWQYGGINSFPISGFTAEPIIGGNEGVRNFVEEMNKIGIDVFLAHDALRINPEEHGGMSHYAMRGVDRFLFEEEVFGNVYSVFNFLNPRHSVRIMGEAQKSYLDNYIYNIMISGISNTLFSHLDDGVHRDRGQTANSYREIIANLDASSNLILEKPFSYLWRYTGAIVDFPTSSSNYVFADRDVPFLALALRGLVPLYADYTNFKANPREHFLRLAEQGIFPSFLITYEDPSKLMHTNSSHIFTSKYENFRDTIKDFYEPLKNLHESIRDALVTDRTTKDGLVRVAYDNGIVVYINYNDEQVVAGEQVIEAKSFEVVRKDD